MKKFLKTSWIILCVFLLIFYLIASASTFIPPTFFSYISIFAIAFPYILIVIIICCIISFFISKKLGWLLLIALFFGYRNTVNSFAFNADNWHQKKDSNSLRIMTWNVEDFQNPFPESWHLSDVRTQMLKTIQQLNPDIMCFQEYKNIENGAPMISVQHLLDSIGYHFNYCSDDSVNYFKSAKYKQGVVIFSKKPFADSSRIKIDINGNENLAYADVIFQNKRVRIFTAHLLSFSLYTDTSRAADKGKNIYKLTYDRKHPILTKLKETEIIHEKEVTIIRKTVAASPYPVVYCGDMNTTPASYNYRILKDDLQDAFLEKGFGLGTTFYKIIPTLRIDVCFADKKLKVLQCKVEEKKLSDHYPVITDLQWK
ncbi:MAG: endonuclease/exonuclease/phosphatase family protein [Chitinophagaceae bacterium]